MAQLPTFDPGIWLQERLDAGDNNPPLFAAMCEANNRVSVSLKTYYDLGLTHEEACRLVYLNACSWLTNA